MIARTHGIDGTVILSDTVGIRTPLAPGTILGIGFSREFVKEFAVDGWSSDEHRTTLRLRGITTPEQASALIDQAVYARPQDIGLADKDRFSIADIEACTVFDESSAPLGSITDVWLLPANDVWVLTTSTGTIPLPVIDDVIRSVDVENKRIVVRLLPGLETINESSPDDESDA